MKYCSNCGYELQGNNKFCTQCGSKIGSAVKNKANENVHSGIFEYKNIKVNLNDIKARHGKNKINAIKELSNRTGMNLSKSKEVIDKFYLGEEYTYDDVNIKNSNKGCISIILWILFLPIMLINYILESDKFNKNIKILLIIGSFIISLPHIVAYISILISSPMLILIGVIFFLVFKYKKNKEAKSLEEKRLKEQKAGIERERKERIMDWQPLFRQNLT